MNDFCNFIASIPFDLYVHKQLLLTAACYYPAAEYFTSEKKKKSISDAHTAF